MSKPDGYDYIRNTYKVDPIVGQIIQINGREAEILEAHRGSQHYLHVRMMGSSFPVFAHPTWEVDGVASLSTPVPSHIETGEEK